MPETYHLTIHGKHLRHLFVSRTLCEVCPEVFADWMTEAPDNYPNDCLCCGRFFPLVRGLFCLDCTRRALRKQR